MSEYTDHAILDPNEYDLVIFDDGKLYLYNSDDESVESQTLLTEEAWIEKYECNLKNIFNEFKELPLSDGCTFPDFCEYIYYADILCGKSDINIWINEMNNYKYKFTNLKNPSIKEFSAHYYEEIVEMYTFLERNSSFCIGLVEDFIHFIWTYTNIKVLK